MDYEEEHGNETRTICGLLRILRLKKTIFSLERQCLSSEKELFYVESGNALQGLGYFLKILNEYLKSYHVYLLTFVINLKFHVMYERKCQILDKGIDL